MDNSFPACDIPRSRSDRCRCGARTPGRAAGHRQPMGGAGPAPPAAGPWPFTSYSSPGRSPRGRGGRMFATDWLSVRWRLSTSPGAALSRWRDTGGSPARARPARWAGWAVLMSAAKARLPPPGDNP